nr:hypothetical protein [Tanacetum cinerariifolium]
HGHRYKLKKDTNNKEGKLRYKLFRDDLIDVSPMVETDPSEDPSLEHVATLLATSPFLFTSSDSSESFREIFDSSDSSSFGDSLWSTLQYQPNGVRKMLNARKRVQPLPSLILYCSTLGHPSEHSSPSPPPRKRSPATLVPSATHAPRALSNIDSKGRNNNHRKKLNMATGTTLFFGSNGVLNDTTPRVDVASKLDGTLNVVTLVSDIMEGVSLYVVDMDVEKENLSSLECNAILGSFPPLPTQVTTLALLCFHMLMLLITE